MTERDSVFQKLREIEDSLNIAKQQISSAEKNLEELKAFFEEKGETKIYIRITYTAEDEVCKAKRGVFYGFIKNQEIVKKNIRYESLVTTEFLEVKT